jgi:hypothetical protein
MAAAKVVDLAAGFALIWIHTGEELHSESLVTLQE